jgi:hypothetical protein
MARHQYVIDEEIKSLLPPHTEEEASFLRINLTLYKHCDDLVVLYIESEDKNVLGDGHHREVIALELGISFNTRLIRVADRPAALAWVVRNQMGRRNLVDERRSYFRGKEYQFSRKGSGRPADGKGDAAQVVADRNGVSPRTVRNDDAFAAACDALPEEEKERILSGKSGKSRSQVVKEHKEGQAPILCERCARLGKETPASGCARCQGARRDARKDAIKRKREAKSRASDTVDAHGTAIPKGLLPAWNDPWIGATLETFGVALDSLLQTHAGRELKKRIKYYPFYDLKDFEAGMGFATNYLEQLIEHLKEHRPHAVCPVCNGKKCGHCRQSGLVSQAAYDKIRGKADAHA